MFNPTLLGLLRLLSARPGGVSREEAYQHLGTPPDWVERALDRLLGAGVVEEKGDKLLPLPGLKPLAQQMERLALRLNRDRAARDAAMELVRVILRGF